MRVAFGLLAVSMAGADAPSPTALTYQVRVVEMNGLGWRGAVYPQLQPVTRQGGAAVWTAPRAVVPVLLNQGGRVLTDPKVTALPNTPAHLSSRSSRKVVTELTREADGPINHASYVGYAPKAETTREGVAVTITGRRMDQGVLAQMVLEDDRVTAVHSVALTEVQEPRGGKGHGHDKGGPGARWEKVSVTIQVPEVSRGELAGEWLIPNDGVLVASLGAYTVDDGDGKAVVRERLALIEANPSERPSDMTVVTRRLPTGAPAAVPMPMPMTAPAVPSRSLPQPLDAVGVPVPLPPLPDDHAPPTAMPDSSEPCATPQVKSKAKAKGDPAPEPRGALTDPDSTRASYDAETECCAQGGDCAAPARPSGGASSWAPAQGKGVSFRIPLNANLTIEFRASATPVFPAPPLRAPNPARAN
jgi:hypothetical protein